MTRPGGAPVSQSTWLGEVSHSRWVTASLYEHEASFDYVAVLFAFRNLKMGGESP